MTSVHIEGDRSQFLSKHSIDRFKNDLRGSESVDPVKYFKTGWGYKIRTRDSDSIRIEIVQLKEEKSSDILRSRIYEMKNKRISQDSVRLKMQKTVPADIVDAYLVLKKTARVPIIDPRIVMSKPDEHHKQLGEIVKSFGNVTNPYVAYHKLLFTHLDNLQQTRALQQLATS